jgi:glycosyltransferase involved in cell wall biosynthesis
MKTPILFISDAPTCQSGLGRICRDLAVRLHENCGDVFEVSTLGYGGFGSKSIPFQQYSIEGMHDWLLPTLPDVWEDFAGDRRGICLAIWDASRLSWFAHPKRIHDKRLGAQIAAMNCEKWGYFPIDASGPNGKLTAMMGDVLTGFDRILAYTSWAENIIRETIGKEESDKRGLTFLPHGIDTSVFYPRPRDTARRIFHEALGYQGPAIRSDDLLIGIVATNQIRKDYGLGIQVVAELAKKHRIRLFIQTDVIERHWNMQYLLADFGLHTPENMVNTGMLSDEVMAQIYSACDVTLGIGAEGFGYPLYESIACGTPVVHGRYAGGAERLPLEMLVTPTAMRIEGVFNCVRPVFRVADWVKAVESLVSRRKKIELPIDLAWPNLWERWESWFREGIK